MMQPIDKLITTLGTGNYQLTHYRLREGDEPISTQFFPIAIVRWMLPQQVYVLLTDAAMRHSNWQNCRAALAELIPADAIHEVRIPEGKSEQELWQIFEAIAGVVSEGDRLIMDVTHGFRSLPMLILLAIAYLRQVKNVQVERILYGAFEAKDAQDIAPVFDLTPFVSLLDWLTAAKIFMTTGDGRELANLMENAQNQAFQAGVPNPPRQLKSLASSVRNMSENLLLSRVPLLAKSAQELEKNLERDTLISEIQAWLPPLVPLFDQIRQEYAGFARDDLQIQLSLIEWYRAHGHLVQAYTLAREWLVNYEISKNGNWEARNIRENREDAEKSLKNGFSKPKEKLKHELWRRLGDYRNDIAHCGFREHSKPARTLSEDLKQMIAQMKSLLAEGETP